MSAALMPTEVRRLRDAAERDGCVARLSRRTGRGRTTLYRYCGDIIRRKRAEAARRDLVGAWDATPVHDREELAESYGYASANSMSVMVWRRRKRNVEARA